MNAQEKLLNEIERVRKCRSQLESLRNTPNVIVEPQIIMMAVSIEAAKKAAASNDAFEVLQALKDLEGWEG